MNHPNNRNSENEPHSASSPFPGFLSSRFGLSDFPAEHVTPYDAATDNYDRPPFAADIKEGKNDPIYNAHSYHTKVPPRSIIPYILHSTQPGDLVLDVFCGSGMTGLAAQMCAHPPADILEQFPELKDRVGPRACILNDLSPAACHIAYNYNTPVDVAALKREFERNKAAVKDEFDWLYGTEHYEPAVGLYDPANFEVRQRLKCEAEESNLEIRKSGNALLSHAVFPEFLSSKFETPVPRTWDLLTKAQVEERLGYPVTELPRDEDRAKLDVAKVAQWICIPATIQYTIWSDVYRCEGFVTLEEPTGKVSTRGKTAGKPILSQKRVARGCGKNIVLWEAAVDHKTGEVAELFTCPDCQSKWKKMQLRRQGSVPVVVNIASVGLKRIKRGCEPARLFQSVLKDHVTADVFRRAEKQCRAASSKITRQLEREGAKDEAGQEDDGQTTLDFGEKG
jgi:hypothetical protein